MPAGQYVAFLQIWAADLLDEGRPASYPATLAAVTRLAFDRLRARTSMLLTSRRSARSWPQSRSPWTGLRTQP